MSAHKSKPNPSRPQAQVPLTYLLGTERSRGLTSVSVCAFQETPYSSSCGSRSWSSCTGTTTSLCSSTPGTPTRTWSRGAAGSWRWTSACTPWCTRTTPCAPRASASPGSSPCSSRCPRSFRCWWAASLTAWSSSGCSRSSAPRTSRTSSGPPSCTSATLCSSATSSLRPTSAARWGGRGRPTSVGTEEEAVAQGHHGTQQTKENGTRNHIRCS